MTIPIRWGDMDPMGHVNNTVYFRYFESVRLGWLHQVRGWVNFKEPKSKPMPDWLRAQLRRGGVMDNSPRTEAQSST